MIQYFIVCPLVFVAGLIDAIAGGGGLISLPAYMIAGLPVHNAIATNKLSSSLGTSMATFQYARKGYIPWKLSLGCVFFSIVGSNIGAKLSLSVSDSVLKVMMLFLLPMTAFFVFRSKSLVSEHEPFPPQKTFLFSSLFALVFGAYDGFYGPGTGTFLLLFLTVAAHLKLTTANGVTKAINFASNVSALAVYLFNGKALIPLGLAAGVFSIAGNYIGSQLFNRKGTKIVKPVMLTVLGIFFVKVIIELAGA